VGEKSTLVNRGKQEIVMTHHDNGGPMSLQGCHVWNRLPFAIYVRVRKNCTGTLTVEVRTKP